MEPIASSGAGAVFRPSASASDAAALLRHGRVLAAEVLSSGDGSVLLAIARQSIPAQSDLRLDTGARFLVRVEEGADGVVLRMLAAEAGGEEALLAALRGVVGEERPLGESLGALARALRAAPELPAELAALARVLAEHVARPDGDGAALRALLGSLGLAHESALLAALAARGGRESLARARDDLKARLLRAEVALSEGARRTPARARPSRARWRASSPSSS